MKLTFIGDVHGCYQSMLSLLAKIPSYNNRIVFLGDLINKGPDPYLVYRYVRDRKLTSLVGNHELFAIHPKKYKTNWQKQGGISTDNSIKRQHNLLAGKDAKVVKTEMSYFFEKFPPFLVFPTNYGKHLVATHAGISQRFFEKNKSSVKAALQSDITLQEGIVFNKQPLAHIANCIQVIGHQPKPFGPIVDQHNFYLDTGCVYKEKQGMGFLCAATFDLEKESNPQIHIQKNID